VEPCNWYSTRYDTKKKEQKYKFIGNNCLDDTIAILSVYDAPRLQPASDNSDPGHTNNEKYCGQLAKIFSRDCAGNSTKEMETQKNT
ncbi:1761_t:CDS:1, partial [Dentiscutata erythropus]